MVNHLRSLGKGIGCDCGRFKAKAKRECERCKAETETREVAGEDKIRCVAAPVETEMKREEEEQEKVEPCSSTPDFSQFNPDAAPTAKEEEDVRIARLRPASQDSNASAPWLLCLHL